MTQPQAGMKDKNVAGILALFLGWLGVHRFYLGRLFTGQRFWTKTLEYKPYRRANT